jgi:hypothetical protein
MKRGLWIAAVVWVVFWSLYPALGRPRAIATIVRRCRLEQAACRGPEGPALMACVNAADERMRRDLTAMTLRGEYAGYAPMWLGVGVGVPCACALALLAMRRRRLA